MTKAESKRVLGEPSGRISGAPQHISEQIIALPHTVPSLYDNLEVILVGARKIGAVQNHAQRFLVAREQVTCPRSQRQSILRSGILIF